MLVVGRRRRRRSVGGDGITRRWLRALHDGGCTHHRGVAGQLLDREFVVVARVGKGGGSWVVVAHG